MWRALDYSSQEKSLKLRVFKLVLYFILNILSLNIKTVFFYNSAVSTKFLFWQHKLCCDPAKTINAIPIFGVAAFAAQTEFNIYERWTSRINIKQSRASNFKLTSLVYFSVPGLAYLVFDDSKQ